MQAGVLKAEESVDEGGGGPKCCGVFCIKGGAGKSNDEVMHVLGDNPGVVMHLLGKAETGYPTTMVDKGGEGGGVLLAEEGERASAWCLRWGTRRGELRRRGRSGVSLAPICCFKAVGKPQIETVCYSASLPRVRLIVIRMACVQIAQKDEVLDPVPVECYLEGFVTKAAVWESRL